MFYVLTVFKENTLGKKSRQCENRVNGRIRRRSDVQSEKARWVWDGGMSVYECDSGVWKKDKAHKMDGRDQP